MTSHELAKLLLERDDVMVVVRGYEGGVNEITGISKTNDLALNMNDAWYYGKHEMVSKYENYASKYEGKQIIKAIYIGFNSDED